MKILLSVIALVLGLASAHAQCVTLTALNGGIGSSVPTAEGPTQPSQSTWAAPVQPARQGSSGTLGFNDDAVFAWTTAPNQVVTQNGGLFRVSIDGAAIASPTAATIKFAVNGGTLTPTLSFPVANSPIGATGEACANINLPDLTPGRPFEVRAEICPAAGDCEELTSVRKLTVPANSSVMAVVDHGQIAGKWFAVTGATSLTNYSDTSSGTTETVTGIVCTAGPFTPNSMLLVKAAVSRTLNGFGNGYSVICGYAFNGFMNGTNLIVTSAVSGGQDLVANAMSPSTPATGYGCVVAVTTTCPAVTAGPAAGAIGVYTLNASAGSVGLDWTGTGTVSGTALTVNSNVSGTLANGQTVAFSGMTAAAVTSGCTGSPVTSCTLSVAPGNVSSVAMQSGSPTSLSAVNFEVAGALGDSFTLTEWYAGDHAQNVNSMDHADNSLFGFYNPSGAPALTENIYANSVAGSDANAGTRAAPVATVEQALDNITPSNSANGQLQSVGTCTVGITCPTGTVGSGTCLTLHRTGNASGVIPFAVNQSVLYDGRPGAILSYGPYFVDSNGTVSGTNDFITLADYPGGPCINDATVSGGTGSITLFKDFSFSYVQLQCTNAPPTGGCSGPARFSYGNAVTPVTRYARIGGLTIEPDPAVPAPPGPGSSFFNYVGFNSTNTISNALGAEVVYLSNVAVENPVVQVAIQNTIPSGTSNPVLNVSTAALGNFAVNPTSQNNGTSFVGLNNCIPTTFYGGPGGIPAGGNALVTAVSSSGGVTSITMGGNGTYNPLVAFNTCPSGTKVKFSNSYWIGASWRLWFDHVNFYSDDRDAMMSQGSARAYLPVGGGGIVWTNSLVDWTPNGLGGANYNASEVINSRSYGIYTKTFEAVPILVNSSSDIFSDSFNSYYTGAVGSTNTQWIPLSATTAIGSTDFYIPASRLPTGTSYEWTAIYKCGSSATQYTTWVAAYELPAIGGTFGQQSGVPPTNSALVRVNTAPTVNCPAYNGTTSLSSIWILSGSHEDCLQVLGPGLYQSHFMYDGYNVNGACFGGLFELGLGSPFPVGWQDSVWLNSSVTGAIAYPYPTPGYSGSEYQGTLDYNLLIRGGTLAVPEKNPGGLTMLSDMVFDNVLCYPALGSYGAPSTWGVTNLSVINNPSSNGC